MRVLVPLTQIVLGTLALGCVLVFGAAVLGKNPTSLLVGIGFGALGLAIFLVIAVLLLSPESKRREVGQALGCLSLVALIAAAVVFPVMQGAQGAGARTSCLSNMKELATSALAYAEDHDEKLPLRNNWQDALEGQPGWGGPCPLGETGFTYAFNSAVSGKKLGDMADISETVMFFEADAYARNPSGGQEWFVTRHLGRGSVGFCDGHAKHVGREGTSPRHGLRWNP